MANTYSAFYIQKNIRPRPKTDYTFAERIKNAFISAGNQINNLFDKRSSDYIANKMALEKLPNLTQLYVAGALTKIVNGKKINSQMMLDSLFNTYAPALNASLAHNGYNSLQEMKNAVANGTINVSNFIDGLELGLKTVNDFNNREELDSCCPGEEVPIDVITEAKYSYNRDVATQRLSTIETQYIPDLSPVTIEIKANVKNKNAEFWDVNDFSDKIVNAMINKTPVHFRIGKSIYENCIVTEYDPTIKNIYEINFECKIEYIYNTTYSSSNRWRGENRILTNPYVINDDVKYIQDMMKPVLDLGVYC